MEAIMRKTLMQKHKRAIKIIYLIRGRGRLRE